MFAVPGWSVSADKLKTEVANESSGSAAALKGKKRKRAVAAPEVTPENLADLWERVIDKKAPTSSTAAGDQQSGKESRRAKKQRKSQEKQDRPERAPTGQETEGFAEGKGGSARRDRDGAGPGETVLDPIQPKLEHISVRKDEGRKKNNKEKKRPKSVEEGDAPSVPDSKVQQAAPQPALEQKPPAPKLTPLQASMREKLISARFRHLNETLYTRPSADALRLFRDDPGMFEDYHAGFRHQVSVWPQNPVEGYVRDLLSRGRARLSSKQKTQGQPPPPSDGAPPPLPRTYGTCTITDLGCGDARLASALQAHERELNLKILSYDLHSPSALVTRADIAALPLRDGSVDVAVFCLALMGTNWLDFVEEAYRVLRWKGELWVAEIKSRFVGAGTGGKGGKTGGGNRPVAHSVGAKRKGKKSGRDAVAQETDDATDLAVKVDGAEDRRRETNVEAFVEALRKRGFILAGEADQAVDLSNKMFVKMTFLKAAPANRGKMAVGKARSSGPESGFKMKFVPDEDPEQERDQELAILKPCVYKLR